MNKFPHISIILEYLDKKERLEVYDTLFCSALAAELRELLKLVPQPKLREYKTERLIAELQRRGIITISSN